MKCFLDGLGAHFAQNWGVLEQRGGGGSVGHEARNFLFIVAFSALANGNILPTFYRVDFVGSVGSYPRNQMSKISKLCRSEAIG